MKPEKIHLVTYNRATGECEASTLELWIRKDLDLYCKRDSKTPLDWLILSAHETADEARLEVERVTARENAR